MRSSAFRRPRPQPLAIDTANIDSVYLTALHHCPSLIHDCGLRADELPPEDVLRMIGWQLVTHTGYLFAIGRRLLILTSEDGRLMPPDEYRLSRRSEPTFDERMAAGVLERWRVDLVQEGEAPAVWRIIGELQMRDGAKRRVNQRLLYVRPEKDWACVDTVGWVRMGRRL